MSENENAKGKANTPADARSDAAREDGGSAASSPVRAFLRDGIAWLNTNRIFVYANIVLFFFLINGVAAASGCRFDFTERRANSLTSSTATVLAKIDDPILVEAYISQDVPGEIQSGIEPLLGTLREIDRVGGEKINLTIIDPDSEESRKQAEERGVQGLPIEQRKDAESNVRVAYFGVFIQQGETTEVLNLIEGEWFVQDLEYRFLRLIKKFGRSGDAQSGIAFVQAPGLSGATAWQQQQDQNKDNYYGFRTVLEDEQGRVQDVSPLDPIPAGIETLLMIGLPRFEDIESYHIDQFLMRGGNLIVLAKGFEFQMQEPDPRTAQFGLGGNAGIGFAAVPGEDLQRFNEWLGRYGVVVNGEILFEPRQGMPIYDLFGQFVRQFPYAAWPVYARDLGNIVSDNPALAPIEELVLPWTSSLDLREAVQPNVSFEVLIRSTSGAVRRDGASLDYGPVAEVGSGAGDIRTGEAAPMAVFASGKFQSGYSEETLPEAADPARFRSGQAGDTASNLVVIGTPYLVSDLLLRNQAGLQVFGINRAFVLNLLEAVQGDTDLIAARSRVPALARLDPFFPESPTLQSAFETLFTYFHVLAIPAILAIFGTLRLLRRNQRRGLAPESAPEVLATTEN
ncbi:MAG: GldG family protein [bacterium]|nr:GldG family protein [bacterium]